MLGTGDDVLVDGEPVGHLIAADGLHSPVRRMLGLDAPAPAVRRYGLRTHVATAPWSSFVEVHWSEAGEAYVTPVAAGLVGVAVLTRLRGPLPDLLATFPRLAPHLAGQHLSRPRGAGYVDALTGEGIALGLAQARAAVAAVTSGDLAGYERAWRRATRRHDLMTRGLLVATRHPALRSRVVPAAARLPHVFSAAVNQLARPA